MEGTKMGVFINSRPLRSFLVNTDPDAAFIASARTDVPDLCEALREANELLKLARTIAKRNLLARVMFDTYLRKHNLIEGEQNVDERTESTG
jgi:hypothetical protein